ncbi:MAG: hypothetical protein HFJ39_08755 [Bifidobacterium pseudolongum]|jgi:hypothetical protein|nr:hypothetical protein [Bifidobacterium pseudolongum]
MTGEQAVLFLGQSGRRRFSDENGGMSQTSAGLFARFDDGHGHIFEIPPRLVDVFPLGRSSFQRGGEYQPCKQWDSGR